MGKLGTAGTEPASYAGCALYATLCRFFNNFAPTLLCARGRAASRCEASIRVLEEDDGPTAREDEDEDGAGGGARDEDEADGGLREAGSFGRADEP